MKRVHNDRSGPMEGRVSFLIFVTERPLRDRCIPAGPRSKITYQTMKRDSKIYAKEQQIKLIDNILCNLCSIELSSDGRKYLKKMKDKIQKELDRLRQLEEELSDESMTEPFRGFRFRLPQSLRAPW